MTEKLSKLLKTPTNQPEPEVLIRAFLQKQSTEFLVEQLMNQIQRDDNLFQGLYLKAKIAIGDMTETTALRIAIDRVTQSDDFISWREVSDYASGLYDIVNTLKQFMSSITAEEVIELTEHFIVRLDKSLESIDDSSGEVGGILCDLEWLHLDACLLAKPDPIKLAKRLLHYQMTLSFDSFYDSLNTYKDVLGETGFAHYRALAEKQWQQILANTDEVNRSTNSKCFAISNIMETLAKMSGDINALVAIKSRDLSMPYRYLVIAEIYQKADQPEQALAWAERGVKEFPDRQDNRLRDFLAAEYSKCGRTLEAEQLIWLQFEENPRLEQFHKLYNFGEKWGNWTALRERALTTLETKVNSKANTITQRHPQPTQPDWSQRIEIALWENDLDTAWHFSQKGQCNQSTLLCLAEKLESYQPDNAVILYCKIIPLIVDQTNNQAYRQAVVYLAKLKGIFASLAKAEAFTQYTANLRVQFKAKRNFIKLLNEIIGAN